MRLMSSFNAVAAAGLGLLLQSGAVMAQALETVGAPVQGGTGHQPAGTDLAADLQWLDGTINTIIIAICVFVTALLLIVMVKFNRKSNPTPRTFTHNTPLEIVWTLGPILILVFIGTFSLPALFKQQEIPVADITIKATGNQWFWSYEYPDAGVAFDAFKLEKDQLVAAGYREEDYLLATDNAVVIPVGKTIVMQVTGSDVIHAWAMPAFGVMQSGVPGRLGQLWFKADREGIYFGQCTTLCGKDHAYMPITVKVVSQAAYDKWIESAKAGNYQLASN
ncbi:MAG: ctaC [Rhodobacteraceae bacterium]|uniref:cytochrome c oxidase subunit II n=1 Tax=Cypionkella sp. TaxID=2811411 RepID=UPI001327B6C1|nr:MAG: ctaC [Paracoccaceae bacterium]